MHVSMIDHLCALAFCRVSAADQAQNTKRGLDKISASSKTKPIETHVTYRCHTGCEIFPSLQQFNAKTFSYAFVHHGHFPQQYKAPVKLVRMRMNCRLVMNSQCSKRTALQLASAIKASSATLWLIITHEPRL